MRPPDVWGVKMDSERYITGALGLQMDDFRGLHNPYPGVPILRVCFCTRRQWDVNKTILEETRTIRHRFVVKHDRQDRVIPALAPCTHLWNKIPGCTGIRALVLGFTCLRPPLPLFLATFVRVSGLAGDNQSGLKPIVNFPK